MHVSEARLAANRANSLKSTGPSERGKLISRRNSLKAGDTGAGVVLPEGDQAEVEGRVGALIDELQPRSTVGLMLIRKIATFSVRSERLAGRENAAIAGRVRDAFDAFDEERAARADALFAGLGDNPRGNLRNLRRMPEGVALLLDAWRVLRRALAGEGPHRWGGQQLARAASLAGVRPEDAHETRVGDLSNAIWGEFHALEAHEGDGLDNQGRRDWARGALLGLVDASIAELEAHGGTLDLDRIERDRLEAPTRATFDDSKQASLARRYEADADRGFYKALKEFRQAEAEASARPEAAPAVPPLDRPEPIMGSFRAATPLGDRERSLAFLDDPMAENPVARGSDGQRLNITRPLSPPA